MSVPIPHGRTLRSRLSRVAVASAAALITAAAWAVDPFVLRDIRVEGLQRTDPGTVFAALPFRIGDTYNDEKGSAALRALFATGLFKDVRLEIDNGVVVVIVEERPIIQSIDFAGLKEFEKDVLVKALKDSGIGEGLPFDRALADRAEQELKRQYLTRSLYAAEVVTTVTPRERNRVAVTFTINEGRVARIGSVRIEGATAFSESTLRSLMELTPSGWFTWYTRGDRYSRAKLNADLEAIRAYYLNRGYLEFQVESAQVAISPDKESIDITIKVFEGQPYTVTAVRLEGDFLGKEDEFKALVAIKPGEPYRDDAVVATTRAFVDRFATFGYAFARVEPNTDIDRANGRVVVTLSAQPQRRIYVRRINIAGNSRTRDEVIRREFRQFESSWYDGRKIKLSRDRIDRLGYFKDVNVETSEIAGAADQVDLLVTVTEKPTGNLMVGAGYSSADRLSLTASISQDNVFGSGNSLGIQVNTSRLGRLFVLKTVDPYFTVDGVSRALDLYYRTERPFSLIGGTDYQLVTPGASVRFGLPVTEYDTVFVGIGAERTEIRGGTNLPNNFYLYREQFGATSSSVPISLGWARDQRDSAIAPTSGRYQRVDLVWGIAGDTRYVRANLQHQQFVPIGTRLSLGLNGELGYGRGLGGRAYPIFKNFYGGGLGTVRNFAQNSLGPVDVTGAYLGGTRRINVNAELYLPVPGTGTDRSLRWFTYVDSGNVWGETDPVTFGDFRASAGVGLSWISPLGPLKLSWGSPVRRKPADRIERLQFQIGTAF